MSDPWDFIEPSTVGDDDIQKTFAGIGEVIHEWGRIEVGLSHLYAILSGRPRDGTAIREYRTGNIFVHRANALCRVGQSYFTRNPCQRTEAQFDGLLRAAQGFSNRRNEVAHGVVRRGHLFNRDRTPIYALVPPYFDERKFNEKGAPEYRYTSENLRALAIALARLEDEIDLFSDPMVPAGGRQ